MLGKWSITELHPQYLDGLNFNFQYANCYLINIAFINLQNIPVSLQPTIAWVRFTRIKINFITSHYKVMWLCAQLSQIATEHVALYF